MLQILAPLIAPIIDKALDLIPNENDRQRAKEDMERGILDAANQALLGQLEINKVEAAHKSIFVAGWRPFIGWVCGAGIAWAFVGQPVANWAVEAFGLGISLPIIPTDNLMELVLAMLGMGGLRTFEKLRGVAREK